MRHSTLRRTVQLIQIKSLKGEAGSKAVAERSLTVCLPPTSQLPREELLSLVERARAAVVSLTESVRCAPLQSASSELSEIAFLRLDRIGAAVSPGGRRVCLSMKGAVALLQIRAFLEERVKAAPAEVANVPCPAVVTACHSASPQGMALAGAWAIVRAPPNRVLILSPVTKSRADKDGPCPGGTREQNRAAELGAMIAELLTGRKAAGFGGPADLDPKALESAEVLLKTPTSRGARPISTACGLLGVGPQDIMAMQTGGSFPPLERAFPASVAERLAAAAASTGAREVLMVAGSGRSAGVILEHADPETWKELTVRVVSVGRATCVDDLARMAPTWEARQRERPLVHVEEGSLPYKPAPKKHHAFHDIPLDPFYEAWLWEMLKNQPMGRRLLVVPLAHRDTISRDL